MATFNTDYNIGDEVEIIWARKVLRKTSLGKEFDDTGIEIMEVGKVVGFEITEHLCAILVLIGRSVNSYKPSMVRLKKDA